jgi:DNA-binding NarL/FixJ family response regulator
MAAAVTLEKAATLSPRTKERTLRLLAAAEAAWSAGSADRARGFLADAGRSAPADLAVAVTKLQGRIEVRRGDFQDALSMLLDTAEALLATDPAASLRVLADAEEATLYIGDPEAIVRIGSLAERLAGLGDAAVDPFLARTLTAFGYIFGGDAARAAPLLRAALQVAEVSDDPDELLLGQRVASLLGDDDALSALPARAVRLARERGAVGFLPRALERIAYAELRSGRYASSRADAAEALRLARETGQEPGTPLCLLALVAGIQGRDGECRACAAEALERARERRSGIFQVLAVWAVGLLELGSGRPGEALSALDSVLPGKGVLTHPMQVLFLLPDHVEAAVRAGQPERAEVSLTMFEGWAEVVRQPWTLALLAYCRGFLAEGDVAEARFHEALELLSSSAHPFEQARAELALGEALRRNRKRREAREHLRAAMNAFERLGATPWMERATQELRASGETARKRDPSTLGDLTPQELQIARLVASGARNREVAAQLFLSPRTIDYHLRKVFTKLGISSRAELGQLDLDAHERVEVAVAGA